METDIIIPKKYKFLFKVSVEDANGGKLIETKELGMISGEDLCEDPIDKYSSQEYVACKIEYKSPQSLFDTGVDFGLILINEINKTRNTSINQ